MSSLPALWPHCRAWCPLGPGKQHLLLQPGARGVGSGPWADPSSFLRAPSLAAGLEWNAEVRLRPGPQPSMLGLLGQGQWQVSGHPCGKRVSGKAAAVPRVPAAHLRCRLLPSSRARSFFIHLGLWSYTSVLGDPSTPPTLLPCGTAVSELSLTPVVAAWAVPGEDCRGESDSGATE